MKKARELEPLLIGRQARQYDAMYLSEEDWEMMMEKRFVGLAGYTESHTVPCFWQCGKCAECLQNEIVFFHRCCTLMPLLIGSAVRRVPTSTTKADCIVRPKKNI